jgi:hypothetical protein
MNQMEYNITMYKVFKEVNGSWKFQAWFYTKCEADSFINKRKGHFTIQIEKSVD